jgi:pectate lyase
MKRNQGLSNQAKGRGKRLAGVATSAVLACSFLAAVACTRETLVTAPKPKPAANATPDFSLVGFASQHGSTEGGAAGRTVTATSLAELITYAKSAEPLIIKIDRKISAGAQGASVNVKSGKTLLGVGTAGFLEGVGLNISGQKNIIVQNLKFTMSIVTNTTTNSEGRQQVAVNDGDCITIQNGSTNVWVDHCEFYNLDPIAQPNQDLYDGLVDAKANSAYITISWCYFHDHHKCHLIGSSDKDDFDRKVTFHHNYYYNITERVPVYRFGTGHVFNNYYKHVYGTGVNSRMGACLKVEKNYFEDVKDPITTKNSAQPGNWDATGNYYTACKGSQPATSTCTLALPYAYTTVLTEAVEVKAVVTQWAGVGKL